MIQILGLRSRIDKPELKREVFFTRNWRLEKIQDVFDSEKLSSLIEKIPVEERYNLYFTVADCFEESGRKLKEQWAIPFDIDDIHVEAENTVKFDALRVAEEAIGVLGLDYRDCGIVFSGNGVQFFVLLDAPILSKDFFDSLRPHYVAVCAKIQARLDEKNIKGKVDTSVFSAARLMRLPETYNRKPNKPTRLAVVVNGAFAPKAFDLRELSGLQHLENAEVVSDVVLKTYPAPDTKGVCEGCAFLKHCKASPATVSEPEWYAMLSITSRLENGRELSHKYSEGHPSYSHYETEHKIEQALSASGPRLCKGIDALWGKCNTCENYEKVVSPILIKGPDYISSTEFGYRIARKDDEGKIILGKPVYQDLIKKFRLENPYKVIAETEQICVFDGVKWSVMLEPYLKSWMTKLVKPAPTATEMSEFIAQIKATNVAGNDWFLDTTYQKLNFKNCVLDTVTGEVHSHKPEYGFFTVLPFDYDRHATAPTWDKFILDIANGDAGLVQMLEEFGGYCISGDPCWLEKALLIVGEGANGKSTFMETLGNVVGANNRSSVPFQDLEKDTKKYLLVNKLFNYSEETSAKALFESSTFKNLVTGGSMTVKQLYLQEYEVKNRAKFILSANELPYSADKSHGFLRRLIIVKLNKQFNAGQTDHDPFIRDKLNKELSGICNRLIDAYSRLKRRGQLTKEYDSRAHVEEYMLQSNNVARFYRDEVILEEGSTCIVSDLYQSYVSYCETNGERPFASNKFFRLLEKEIPNLPTMRTRPEINGKRVRVYEGIKINGAF